MLPSRPRLISWNPDSLAPAATSIGAAGRSVYRTVLQLDDGCDGMAEARTWSGKAHDEATVMFGRATVRSSHFLDYTGVVADALSGGSSSIGQARTALLRQVDAIERGGELTVTDQWVVLIKPAGMTAEQAADLQKQAEAAQGEINPLLLAVGDADEATAQKLLLARASKGAAFNVHRMGPPGPVPPAPGNEVADPSTESGRQLQTMVREQDMSTTVRETSETTDEQTGNHIKTLSMLDGSRQVITTEAGWPPSEHVLPEGSIAVEHYDKDGNYVSDTLTTESEDGTRTTNIWWTDGTSVVMTRTPAGKCSGAVTTPDGRHGVLPDGFFTEPLPDVVGGALTALEMQAGQGIPGLSARALDNIEVGAKFGGPALGVVTALYDVATAETKHDVCVAAWKGGVGVAGGMALDTALTVLQPELAPIWVGVASATTGYGFGYLGELVGDLVCPP